MKRKIIIGYDPAHHGEDALALGRTVAELLDARPIVAVITQWVEGLLDRGPLERAIEEDLEEPRRRAEEVLAGLEPRVVGFPRLSPASALQDLAVAEQAVLIVIGSSHRGRLGRLALGSVGESLLNGAPCAIALAPAGYAESERRAIREVGVAFDGSAEAWAAIEAAVGVAERTGSRLTIVTVAGYPNYGYATSWSILTTGEYRDFEQQEKRRILELALSRVPADLPHETRLLTGEPGRMLAQASADFDLMVTGSRGYGPLRRTLLGTATRKLLRSGGCPVLVLPRAARSSTLGLGPDGGVADSRRREAAAP